METESAASLRSDLLRLLPTLLTVVVLGGAAIVAMGGLKHRSPAVTTALAPAVAAPAPTAMPVAAPVTSKYAVAEVIYLVDSPAVQEALKTSPTLKRGTSEISFDVLLIQSPQEELAAQQILASTSAELTVLGIDLEVIDLRDPAARGP